MTITVSAGELAEYCFPDGSLGVMPSIERMSEGTRAHKKLQNLYAENEAIKYRREVNMEYSAAGNGYELLLQGRADGIFFDKEYWYIHEIKSTYTAAASITEPLKRAHKAQMMIYAFIFAREQRLETVKCRLTYFCLGDEQLVDFDYTFEFDALKISFEAMLKDYMLLLDRRIKAETDFVISAEKLKFPFEGFRPGQREGAAQVYTAVKRGKILFLQAPTGSGKTMMTLFPAVKAVASDGARIFCLSAKNQTMAVNERAIELMQKNGLKVKSCTISAKSKCCPMNEQNCKPDYCPYSLDFFPRLHDAMPEILKADDFSAGTISELGQKYTLCPYELSLALAEESRIIMCDYNYLFDPTARLKRFFDEKGKYAFLIDEAHNLPERGRDMFSATVFQKDIREERKQLEKGGKIYKCFGSVLTELNRVLKSEGIDGKESLKKLNGAIISLNEAAAREEKQIKGKTLLYIKELYRFTQLWDYYDSETHKIIVKAGSLTIRCLDSSAMLRESLACGDSAVLYSATLSPYEYFKNSIVPEAESFGFNTQYPFDKSNLLCMADYGIDTRFGEREKYYKIIAEKIRLVRNSTRGNIIVYFPSYKFMNEVNAFFENALVQKSDADTAEREKFINEFCNGTNKLAFAVMGSHFSEGIDIKGLKGIIIVGVALPQFNDERDFLRKYYDKRFNAGFEYAYIYPGISKVCQAAGRLIRTASDKGFILLLDRRFKQYGYLLPEHWAVKDVKNDEDIRKLLSSKCDN